jgi:hypothetical protein
VSREPGLRYRFGPRERGGGIAGWRTGQIVTVAIGLLLGVLTLRWQPDAAGVAAAIGILVLYGALATVPVAGRTGDEWLPVTVCWAARRLGRPGRRPLGALRGLRLLETGWQGMGVVHDRRARTLTAALALRGRSFALLAADEQDRRVGAWSSVLASLAREGSPVYRVQWVTATFPDDGRGVRDFLADTADAQAASAARASYESLLEDIDLHACAHDVVLAISVRLTKSLEVGCAALARELGALVRQLGDAEVQVDAVLGPGDLAHRMLRSLEPQMSTTGPNWPAGDPWPMAMEERWSSVRVDGLVHATFWVAEWPRVEVRSDFLAPLLLGSVRATFAVVMAPLGSDLALRKVEASRTADLADAELRRRGGFVSTARQARESEVLARREDELAEGHASFRYSGYLTVSAASDDLLESAIDALQHSAGQSRLALRRLYGDQASAYTCTLPFCRGLQ